MTKANKKKHKKHIVHTQ